MLDPDSLIIKIVMPFGYSSESACTLREARDRLFGTQDILVIAEGELVNSYDELVLVAAKEKNRAKEFIEVKLSYLIGGG
jgi:hypothetical protein